MTHTDTALTSRAAQILAGRSLVRQDNMLRYLSGPAGIEPGLAARLAAAPMIDMVWDEYGQPYYVHADRLAQMLEALPHRIVDGAVVIPTHVAQGSARPL